MTTSEATLAPQRRSDDPEVIAKIRGDALAALPRIGTSRISERSQLVRRLEDIALDLGDTVEQRRTANDPHWWQSQDLLDDVLDVLDAARTGVT